jgi:hypothetical protein
MSTRVAHDPDTQVRALRLRRMMDEFLAAQTPQERDRMMQLHLAQARGPKGNARALVQLMDFAIKVRKEAGPRSP